MIIRSKVMLTTGQLIKLTSDCREMGIKLKGIQRQTSKCTISLSSVGGSYQTLVRCIT
jgi:hypothetical protein